MGVCVPDSIIAVGWADLGVYKTIISVFNLRLSHSYKVIIIIGFTSTRAAISSLFIYLYSSSF